MNRLALLINSKRSLFAVKTLLFDLIIKQKAIKLSMMRSVDIALKVYVNVDCLTVCLIKHSYDIHK